MKNKCQKNFILSLGFSVLSLGFNVLSQGVMFSKAYTHRVLPNSTRDSLYIWAEKQTFPFSELIVSWNALRPKVGKITVFVRVMGKKWSSWIKYAEWGASRKQSFSYTKDDVVQLDVAAIRLKNDVLATAFDIKVEVSGGAKLSDVYQLHASVADLNKYEIMYPSNNLMGGFIENVPQQSQMLLKHARSRDMCSPTSTSTVLNFLLQHVFSGGHIDPLDFAAAAYDDGFDIYGNWVLNVAAAYNASRGRIPCRVERLSGFDALHAHLLNDRPVVVSIKGPIKGGAKPYHHGHLMVVIGWDDKNRRVLCIDSAFSTNNGTKVWYDSDEFCRAWGRRNNLSYVFMPQQ